MKEITQTWEKMIHIIRETADKYTQESYSPVVHAIQYECIFLQRATKNMGDKFAGVGKMLQEKFPSLFSRKSKVLLPIVGTLSMITSKKDGLVLLNPVI